MNPNEFADFIKLAGKKQRVVEFEYPFLKDFYVELVFASKFIMNQIYDTARKVSDKGDSATISAYGVKIPVERLDKDKLREAYAGQIVIGWRGLTIKKLQGIVPGLAVDLTLEQAKKLFPKLATELAAVKTDADLQKVIEKVDLPYTVELAFAMLEVTAEFENWVIFTATDSKNYSKVAEEKEKEIKNLK